jgi:hypothetical protein
MWNRHNDNVDTYAQYYISTNADTSYDGYQQAWRMLGIYVDCSNYNPSFSNGNNNNNNDNNNNKGCTRYLVWAAYVDVNYQGGTIGEYAYYNRTGNNYDDSICNITKSTRCARMDCHDSKSTTWSLMGIYKEPYYGSEWFEQLFKHFGYCAWDETTYEFMHSNYENWPEKCVQSKVYHPITNTPFYIDLKPGPNLELAVYTDAVCFHEYDPKTDNSLDENTAATVDTDAIIQSVGYLSSNQLVAFNDGMMTFKICQPCNAVNLYNGNNKNRRKLNDGNDNSFSCNDAAGYTNVNQCMKFRTKTTMMSMTPKDIHVAFVQGAITDIQFYHLPTNTTTVPETVFQSSYKSIYFQSSVNDPSNLSMKMSRAGVNVLLLWSIVVLIGTMYYSYKVFTWMMRKHKKSRRRQNKVSNQPNNDTTTTAIDETTIATTTNNMDDAETK